MNNSVKESFIGFLNKEIPPVVSAYTPMNEHILIDVFAIEPEKKNTIAIPDSTTKTDLGYAWTTVARVIAVGESEKKSFVKVGDIVKLSDYKVATFTGTDYEQWTSLSEKGSVKKIGAVPPKKVTRFWDSFMRFVFNPFPIINNRNYNLNLFLVPGHEIVAIIKNPHDLINM